MKAIPDSLLCELIGVAVLSSQAFEHIFVLAAKHAIKQADAQTIEDVVPVNASKASKQPIAAILKEISGDAKIEGFEDRIAALVENRNRLVHRLVSETTWTDEKDREVIKELCFSVMSESMNLHRIFTQLFGEWLKRFPAMKDVVEEYEIFKAQSFRFLPPNRTDGTNL